MAVYVDDMQLPATVANVRGNWSHMWADTEGELLTFAERLGLKPSWIQRGSLVHFDVVDTKRREAIKLGAIPLSVVEATANRRAMRERDRNLKGKPHGSGVVDTTTYPSEMS